MDPESKDKEQEVAKLWMMYDIELYKIDTSGIEDIGSISRTEFDTLKDGASSVSLDDYFLMDELRRVI